jgi:hypothetical protein
MRAQRAYRFRCYPTSEQAAVLARTFGSVRYVYNWALRLRTDAYYQHQERVSSADTSAALTLLKREPETTWLQEVSSVPPQQALRHLDRAFRTFFEGRAKYPAFHKKHGKQAAQYTTSAFRWDARTRTLTLAKMDAPLEIRWSRPLPDGAIPSTVTVSRDTAGRSFVSLLVEEEIALLPPIVQIVGIDLGWQDVVVLDTGEKVGNPRFFHQDEQRLAKAQKRLAKKKLGSKNRAKVRLAVARLALVAPAGVPTERSVVGQLYPLAMAVTRSTPSFLPIVAFDALRAGPVTTMRAGIALLAQDVRAAAKQITAPTLLVWGRRDPLVPPAHGAELRRHIPNARLLYLDRAGHIPMQDWPHRFNAAITTFLQGAAIGA